MPITSTDNTAYSYLVRGWVGNRVRLGWMSPLNEHYVVFASMVDVETKIIDTNRSQMNLGSGDPYPETFIKPFISQNAQGTFESMPETIGIIR
jgi:hypothetical protein